MANKLITTELQKRYDEKLKVWVTTADEKVLSDAKAHTEECVKTLNDGTVAENKAAVEQLNKSVTDINGRIDGIEAEVGDLEELETTSKTDLVEALNEVRRSVSAGNTASVITISTDTTTDGALKSYTFKQGDSTIGTIDIPKDMVVESGTVVTNPEGQPEGTYIKLVLANVADPLYINVGTLVDIYKAKENATQIQLAIDSSTREISATIVVGSIGTTELADGSITTVKIADANVTLAKLSTAIQASLAKADSAVQNVAEGTTNGTVSVDGADVAVHGLGSAAFTESSAFDTAGAADAVQTKLNEEAARAKAAEEQVLKDAKEYAEQKVAGVDLSGIDTNANAINALTERVASEESKSTDFESRIAAFEDWELGTEADIDAMFE